MAKKTYHWPVYILVLTSGPLKKLKTAGAGNMFVDQWGDSNVSQTDTWNIFPSQFCFPPFEVCPLLLCCPSRCTRAHIGHIALRRAAFMQVEVSVGWQYVPRRSHVELVSPTAVHRNVKEEGDRKTCPDGIEQKPVIRAATINRLVVN